MTRKQIIETVETALNYSLKNYSKREKKSLGTFIEYVYYGAYRMVDAHKADGNSLLKEFNDRVLDVIAKGIEIYSL